MMQKPQSQQQYKNQQQQGSVLFMALIFLILTALIAVTIMDTSILSRKMAGNSQFREDAMQISEGIANETVAAVIKSLEETIAPNEKDVICMKTSTDSDCTTKTLEISPELAAAAGDGILNYKAVFYSENPVTTSRSSEDDAGATTDKFFDVLGSFDGVPVGLSQASLAIGVKARFTAGVTAASAPVKGGEEELDSDGNQLVAAGGGSGTYSFNN